MSLIKRLSLDLVMTLLILVEFAYRLTGSTLHELIGLAMLTLFIVHGAVNWRWFATLLKGRYAGLRTASVTINAVLLISVLLMLVSGVLNSDLLFSLTQVELDLLPRELHTAAAYWLLILIGVHLGMHWRMIVAEARKRAGACWPAWPARLRTLPTVSLHVMAAAIAAHGIVASFERSVLSRLTAYYSFGNVELDESILGFFAQYAAIVGLYTVLTCLALQFFRKRPRSNRPPRTNTVVRNGSQ